MADGQVQRGTLTIAGCCTPQFVTNVLPALKTGCPRSSCSPVHRESLLTVAAFHPYLDGHARGSRFIP